MVKLSDLSVETVGPGLKKMGARAMVAGPFHLALYYFGVMRSTDFSFSSIHGLAFFILVVCVGIRVFQWKFLPDWLTSHKGIRNWLLVFSTNAILMGLAWGMASVETIREHGLAPASLVIILYCFGVASASVSAFSLSIAANVIFQIVISSPAIATLALTVSDPHVLGFISGLVLYSGFAFITAFSLHRFQIEVMMNRETIAKQKEELESAHERIKTMHESLDEAFVIFDSEGICRESPARRGQELLGMDPKGRSIDEVLRVGTNQIDNVRNWYQLLFSDRFVFDETAMRGPKSANFEGSDKVLKFRYHPMRGEDSAIKSVIVTATDTTTEVAATKEARLSNERSNMILRIHDNRGGFRPFLTAFESMLSRLCSWNGEKIDDLKREVHTMKGACLLYGISSLAEKIYETELTIRESGANPDAEFVRLQGAILEMEFKVWRVREMNLFTQLGVFADNAIEVSMRKFSEIEEKFSREPESAKIFSAIGRELMSNELGDLIRDFQFHVNSTAVKLGKSARLEVETGGERIYLPPHIYVEVVRSLVHLFNNALDHGIESPEVRAKRSKPGTGTIRVRYEVMTAKDKPWIQIIIEDDGGGVDIGKLQAVLKSKGVELPEQMAPLEIAMNIFGNGISTSDEVTQISGQGIGMGAVRAAILKARGTIRINRTDELGTRFEILLPIPKEGYKTSLDEERVSEGSHRRSA
jgi:two-component system chemotaxis sensor kinase CheA